MLCSFFYGFPRLSVHPFTHPNNFTSDMVDVVVCFVWFMQINFDPFPTASPTTLYFMVIFTMYILYFCLVSKRKSQHELKQKISLSICLTTAKEKTKSIIWKYSWAPQHHIGHGSLHGCLFHDVPKIAFLYLINIFNKSPYVQFHQFHCVIH